VKKKYTQAVSEAKESQKQKREEGGGREEDVTSEVGVTSGRVMAKNGVRKRPARELGRDKRKEDWGCAF